MRRLRGNSRQRLALLAMAGVIALAVWSVLRAIDPSGRLATIACLAVVGGLATGAYALAVRRWWRAPALIGRAV